jgi:hypothetical protein
MFGGKLSHGFVSVEIVSIADAHRCPGSRILARIVEVADSVLRWHSVMERVKEFRKVHRDGLRTREDVGTLCKRIIVHGGNYIES